MRFLTQPEKRGVSRRGFAKYVVGFVAALAAVAGYGILVHKREEPEVLQPSQTTGLTTTQELSQSVAGTVPQGYADLVLMNHTMPTLF